MPEWKYVLDDQAFEFFQRTRGSHRRRLQEAFEHLRLHPTRDGRWQALGEHGRTLQVELFGKFLVYYWDDFVVKELRIVHIKRDSTQHAVK